VYLLPVDSGGFFFYPKRFDNRWLSNVRAHRNRDRQAHDTVRRWLRGWSVSHGQSKHASQTRSHETAVCNLSPGPPDRRQFSSSIRFGAAAVERSEASLLPCQARPGPRGDGQPNGRVSSQVGGLREGRKTSRATRASAAPPSIPTPAFRILLRPLQSLGERWKL
jgi:hypothetical protein